MKKLSEKELRVIYEAIWNAKSAIENLASENYPSTPFIDSDLDEMFYTLNDMNIKLTVKMAAMKVEVEE